MGEDARLIGVIFVEDLPKSRSGQIIRDDLADIAKGTPDASPYATSAAIVTQIEKAFAAWTEPTDESDLSEKEGKNRGCFWNMFKLRWWYLDRQK